MVCSLEVLNGYGDLDGEKCDTEEALLCKLYEVKVRKVRRRLVIKSGISVN